MLTMTVPWWELVVRSVIVYLFLIVILRISGKRQVSRSPIEGRPQVLADDGKLFEEVMAKAQLTHHELQGALRRAWSRASRR